MGWAKLTEPAAKVSAGAEVVLAVQFEFPHA